MAHIAAAADAVLAHTDAIWRRLDAPSDIPQVVNIVATTTLLATGCTFNLTSLAAALPSSQFDPAKFAAVIFRIRDDLATTAALVFKSGTLVVVHGLSPEHSRSATQQYRLLFESLSYPMLAPSLAPGAKEGAGASSSVASSASLKNRLVFANRAIHNVVASGFLGVRVDLAALVRDAPHVCSWKPGGFPGLKFKVQLKQQSDCRCKELKKSNAATGLKVKCGCTCRCLVFESGKLVIIGVLAARQANEVFYRMRNMITPYENGAFPLRKDQRHDARFAALLCAWGVPLAAKQPVKRENDSVMLDVGSAIAHFIDTAKTNDSQSIVASAPSGLHSVALAPPSEDHVRVTPFMKMCDAGNVNNVRFCIDMGTASLDECDAQGRNALQRLEANPTLLATSPAHQTVLRLLKDFAQVKQ